MADYGDKNKPLRGRWYDEVISPLKTMGKPLGANWQALPNRAQWMDYTRPQINNNKIPTKMRNLAKEIGTDVSVSWTGGKFANLTNANKHISALQEGLSIWQAQEAAFVAEEELIPPSEEYVAEELYADEYDLGAAWAEPGAPIPGEVIEVEEEGLPTWAWLAIGAGVLVVGGLGVWAATRGSRAALPAPAYGDRNEFNGSYYVDL